MIKTNNPVYSLDKVIGISIFINNSSSISSIHFLRNILHFLFQVSQQQTGEALTGLRTDLHTCRPIRKHSSNPLKTLAHVAQEEDTGLRLTEIAFLYRFLKTFLKRTHRAIQTILKKQIRKPCPDGLPDDRPDRMVSALQKLFLLFLIIGCKSPQYQDTQEKTA